MSNITQSIRQTLKTYSEEKYRQFSLSLMPETDENTVIGVRVPILRKYAAQIAKEPEADQFINDLPHIYHEEYLLHGFLIERLKDFNTVVKHMDDLLPYISNWAMCDSISPPIFSKHKDELLSYIEKWLKSEHTFTVRFGIKQLMTHYLTSEYIQTAIELTKAAESDEYYINMCRAWLFATALAKHYNLVLPVLEEKRLDSWTHNKSIQKAVESNRITGEQKAYLRGLKIK